MKQTRELDRFLASIERRAFRIAQIALRDENEALDAVQDAMWKLAHRYRQRPSDEWPPLFYRILQNLIRDRQRRRQVRNRLFGWLPFRGAEDDDDPAQAAEAMPDEGAGVVKQLMMAEAMKALEQAIAGLPLRQQQAFMLRNFEGMDVAQTAAAMGCTEGSVKTHYSRAVHALRERLGETW